MTTWCDYKNYLTLFATTGDIPNAWGRSTSCLCCFEQFYLSDSLTCVGPQHFQSPHNPTGRISIWAVRDLAGERGGKAVFSSSCCSGEDTGPVICFIYSIPSPIHPLFIHSSIHPFIHSSILPPIIPSVIHSCNTHPSIPLPIHPSYLHLYTYPPIHSSKHPFIPEIFIVTQLSFSPISNEIGPIDLWNFLVSQVFSGMVHWSVGRKFQNFYLYLLSLHLKNV